MFNESKVQMISANNRELRMIVKILSADDGEWRMKAQTFSADDGEWRIEVRQRCSQLIIPNRQ